jgi:FKBP-type peptidyl-prolyl cis-trans isomerase
VLGAKTNAILPFWHEATLGMRQEGKKRVIVPPKLAWGEKGRPDLKIGGDETLIFDITIDRVFDKSKKQRDLEAIAATQPDLPTTIPSDLVMEDLKVGTGEYAKKGKIVFFKYIGRFTDGKIFDQGDKLRFTIGDGQMVTGFDLGVRDMRVGGVRKITMPGHLGYGEAGRVDNRGNVIIPPNATLIFEVELMSVHSQE